MKEEKGITFSHVSEKEAEKYLFKVNNFLRTASYRKNYQKYQKGSNEGKYSKLDFAYLGEKILSLHRSSASGFRLP